MNERLKKRLKNRYGTWAVVTGASSGIGQELAERCAEAGLNLIIAARRQATLEALAADWQQAYGVEVVPVGADVATPTGIATVREAAARHNVGLFIAAAGFGTSGPFVHSDLDQEINLLDVNCRALLAQTHHFAQRFAAQRRGGIILLSSMLGFHGAPNTAHYAATKAYVQSLGEALAVELKPQGVDVLSAAPGPVKTGFADRADLRMDMTMTPRQVALPILRALGRRGTVLPGFLTKFLVYSMRLGAPRWGKVRIAQLVMGGMTKHQQQPPPS